MTEPETDDHLVASTCLETARLKLAEAIATADYAQEVVTLAMNAAQKAREELVVATALLEEATRHYVTVRDDGDSLRWWPE